MVGLLPILYAILKSDGVESKGNGMRFHPNGSSSLAIRASNRL